MDETWDESEICIVCGREAKARLLLQTRIHPPGTGQGFCLRHMQYVTHFIRGMIDAEASVNDIEAALERLRSKWN